MLSWMVLWFRMWSSKGSSTKEVGWWRQEPVWKTSLKGLGVLQEQSSCEFRFSRSWAGSQFSRLWDASISDLRSLSLSQHHGKHGPHLHSPHHSPSHGGSHTKKPKCTKKPSKPHSTHDSESTPTSTTSYSKPHQTNPVEPPTKCDGEFEQTFKNYTTIAKTGYYQGQSVGAAIIDIPHYLTCECKEELRRSKERDEPSLTPDLGSWLTLFSPFRSPRWTRWHNSRVSWQLRECQSLSFCQHLPRIQFYHQRRDGQRSRKGKANMCSIR